MPKKLLNNFLKTAPLIIFVNLGCSNQSSVSNRYLTAERLWADKNYAAAAAEFDQILKEEPNSALSLQALLRASMTKMLFLNEPELALQGFKLYLDRAGSSEQVPQVQRQMAEIYFSKLKQYPNAMQMYQKMIDSQKFDHQDTVYFKYRVARCQFLVGKIKSAIEAYEALLKQDPSEELRERTNLDLGHAWYAIGENEKNGFQNAIAAYEKGKPKVQSFTDPNFLEAEFGIGSAMEELDQLEQAYLKFTSIEKYYPAPNVIKVKLMRLDDRLKKKRK